MLYEQEKRTRTTRQATQTRTLLLAGAESLAAVMGQCPALAHLNVRSNHFFAVGAEWLAGVLEQFTPLAHLDLRCNDIVSAAAERLAEVLGQYAALAHLNLSWVAK